MLKRQPRDDQEPAPAPIVPAVSEEISAGPPRPAPVPIPAHSLVDGQARLDGTYEAGDALDLQGSVAGRVTCRGVVTIASDAFVAATVIAQSAVVHGRLDGELRCSGRALLGATAVVSGLVQAGTLVVEAGARVEATVTTAAASFDDLVAGMPGPKLRKRA